MGHKHTREEILDGAIAVAFADGLSRLSFGRVAKHLGVSDRMVVYYFASKEILVTDVLMAIGLELQSTLADAFDAGAPDHRALLRPAWPLLITDDAGAVFALFFEANGLAITGQEPYASVVPLLVGAWLDWVATFIDGDDTHRRVEAETAIALVDGLLLLRLVAGADASDRAAERLGLC